MKFLRKSKPFDFKRQTESFIKIMATLFLSVVAVYLTLHCIFLPNESVYRARDFVDINAHGLVTVKSAEDIDWFVGVRKSVPLLQALDNRNKQIVETQARMGEAISELTSRLPHEAAESFRPVAAALQRGEPLDLTTPQPLPAGSFMRLRNRILGESDKMASLADNKPITSNQMDALLLSLEKLSSQLTGQVQGYEDWIEGQAILTNALVRLDSARKSIQRLPPTNEWTSQALGSLIAAQDIINRRTNLDASFFSNTSTNPLADLQRAVADLKAAYQLPEKSTLQFAQFARELTPDVRTRVGGALLVDIESALHRLESLKIEQVQALSSLRRPEKYAMFWMTPSGCMIEVIFWSWFGALTNILVRASEARRLKEFRPSQRYVHYVKLLYAPMVAVAIALAIINGLVSLMGEEVRVWTIPLLGFLFGYHSRRTASLVDKLGEKLLGKAFDSIEKSREERTATARQGEADIAKSITLASLPALVPLAQQKAGQILHKLVSQLDNKR